MKEQEIREKERELVVKFTEMEREFLLSDDEEWVYEKKKKCKKAIRDIAKQVKFKELKDEKWIYYAGRKWSSITDETRRERWHRGEKGGMNLKMNNILK